MRRASRLLPLAFLGLTACSQQPTLPDTSSLSPNSLIDTQWEVAELYGEPVPGRAPTLAFSNDNRSHGYAGCNQFFGQYELQETEFTISRIGSTRMLCEEERNRVEQRYLRGLQTVRQATLQGPELILLDEEKQVVVRLRPAKASPSL